MAVFRSFAPSLLAAALVLAGGPFALADPPPWAHAAHAAPRSHAVVVGTVVGIDYGAATILVGTSHGLVPVAVTPSTSIIRGSTNASLADLGRGARVRVDVTDVGGSLIAQIIRIR